VHRDRCLEEWTHAEKLVAISSRAKMVLADGLMLALYCYSLLCRCC
jgi:hypothetical protein